MGQTKNGRGRQRKQTATCTTSVLGKEILNAALPGDRGVTNETVSADGSYALRFAPKFIWSDAGIVVTNGKGESPRLGMQKTRGKLLKQRNLSENGGAQLSCSRDSLAVRIVKILAKDHPLVVRRFLDDFLEDLISRTSSSQWWHPIVNVKQLRNWGHFGETQPLPWEEDIRSLQKAKAERMEARNTSRNPLQPNSFEQRLDQRRMTLVREIVFTLGTFETYEVRVLLHDFLTDTTYPK